MTDAEQNQLDLYGKILDGAETSLDLAKLARIQYLKKKMRPRLAAAIGDTPDNVTDVLRAIILGEAIQLGIVTDQAVIDAHKAYISAMLEGYGGAQAILAVLQSNLGALQSELVNGYYQAKAMILAAQDAATVNGIDLPGEPVTETLSNPR